MLIYTKKSLVRYNNNSTREQNYVTSDNIGQDLNSFVSSFTISFVFCKFFIDVDVLKEEAIFQLLLTITTSSTYE